MYKLAQICTSVQASSGMYKLAVQLASCSENYKTNIMHRLLGENGVE